MTEKMKVEVNEQGILFINDTETNIEKLNPNILEKILENGLNDNVEFILPSDVSHPVATLIKELKDLTENNSDFRNKIQEIIKEQEENNKKMELASQNEINTENNE